VDIWGMVSIYYELIKKPFDNYKLSSNEYKIYIQMLMNILVKNIFENGAKVIKVGKLVHDIKKVNLFLHTLNPHEEYKKNMNKITSYEDIVSENIHEKHIQPPQPPQPQPRSQHLSNNMKVNDSIALRKLQLNKSVKIRESVRNIMSTGMLTPRRHNKTQRINVIKRKE